MNMRVLGAVVLTLVVLVVLSVRGCRDEEAERIEAILAEMVAAVEAGDGAGLSTYIAADYTDRLGHDDRSIVIRAIDEVEHYPDVRIELTHLSIKVEHETGYAAATFLPVFRGETDEAQKHRPKYKFERGQRLKLKFRKHGTTWLMVRADLGVSVRGVL